MLLKNCQEVIRKIQALFRNKFGEEDLEKVAEERTQCLKRRTIAWLDQHLEKTSRRKRPREDETKTSKKAKIISSFEDP